MQSPRIGWLGHEGVGRADASAMCGQVPRDLVDRGGLQVPQFPADVEVANEKKRSLNDLPAKSPLGDIPKDLTFRAEWHGAQVLYPDSGKKTGP